MKINWFSPLPQAGTDIAGYTARILAALRSRAEIVLWTNQAEWEPVSPALAEVRRFDWRQMDWAALNAADVTVYNIGNNAEFHESIWEISRLHPGVTVLHDTRLHDMFAGIFREHYRDRQAYLDRMAAFYGAAGVQAGERLWFGACTPQDLAERFPLTALALENSTGAVVHSLESLAAVQSLGIPVIYAPLPYPAVSRQKRRSEADTGRDADTCRIIVCGVIGPNRRVDSLIRAIAEFPDRERVRLDVYGSIWDPRHIRDLVQSRGIEHLVAIHGYVPRAELDAALESADLAVNLRFPTMGEASGSQLQFWDHALPVLVTPVGWYGSLPEGTAAFVRLENEIPDIQEHLRAFLADPGPYRTMGENGRRVLERRHSPEAYVDRLMDFLSDAPRYSLRATALKLADRLAAEMDRWLPPEALDHITGKLTEEIAALTACEKS